MTVESSATGQVTIATWPLRTRHERVKAALTARRLRFRWMRRQKRVVAMLLQVLLARLRVPLCMRCGMYHPAGEDCTPLADL